MRSQGESSRFLIALSLSFAWFLLYNSPIPSALGQQASIDIEIYPASAGPGERVTIEWEVEGEGKISHTAVHWDTKPGRPFDFRSYSKATPDFTSINPPHEAKHLYRVSFDAPTSGTIYYIVHAVVDGKDYYNLWERTISISGGPPEGEAEPQSLESPAGVDFTLILPLVVGVVLIVPVVIAIKLTRRRP